MNKFIQLIAVLACGIIAVCLCGCHKMSAPNGSISWSGFGKTSDGARVKIYTLRNSSGAKVSILTYGGIVQKLMMPDRNGQLADVALGFDTLDDYLDDDAHFGGLIGRYANRIDGAQFTLEGKTHSLEANGRGYTIHGGSKGFDRVVWDATPSIGTNGPTLMLSHVSPDGDAGFPGTLTVTAQYTLTEDNELKLEFTATTDKPTVVNFSDHMFFNLAGQGNGDVLGHVLTINANQITPVDDNMIPTGAFTNVAGTPFDFRKPTLIGARINDDDPMLGHSGGYDLNWVINKPPGQLGLVARVVEPNSGRVMEVWSDEPGVQFYTGNALDGTSGKGGQAYQAHGGFCLEPQHYPDSPNQPAFPSTELKPGQTFHNNIIYKFSVEK